MFQNVTLEVSLKPFKKTDDSYIRTVCAGIMSQWRPLLKDRKTVSFMLWTGDGSEILDYAGRMEDTFEWGRFLGTANQPALSENEPLETSLHFRRQDYLPDAPVMTYRILKTIVSLLKEEASKAFPGARIRVGETFDIGPEFAISDFKYNRHKEICSGGAIGKFGCLDATALLNGDDRPYAAYPAGIPDGTPFGTFLGKQSQVFLTDMGFDFLWLSNGLGFSANPWEKTGKIFDGERYYPEKLADTKKKVFSFWERFRRECSFPLETRGTNNSVGIDYASDGVPLYDIYRAGMDITAPANSPWAAINDNFGLEIMGHMTRVCELPNGTFPFRYYLHDPWWVNSPWYDRYDGSPCDIYLPMAISRITGEGRVECANSLNILSIDNSFGNMPDACVNEPLPHILKAEKDVPDAPAPLVWVYPMREYTTSEDVNLLREMNLCDNYICDAINDGLPLCCVVSTDHFLMNDLQLYENSILLSPVPENPAILEKLTAFTRAGGQVMVYGTKEKLQTLPSDASFAAFDVKERADLLREALADCGYQIRFTKKDDGVKAPTMAIIRRDNGLVFSVYNANTTTDTGFHFPKGAPILMGCEAEMRDGLATYRFSRGEHRECRVFAEQKDGVISCREAAPGNVRYRRWIRIRGLEDATVRLFPETGCECAVSSIERKDLTPEADPRFTLVQDEKWGTYLEGKHITGNIFFLIGHRR